MKQLGLPLKVEAEVYSWLEGYFCDCAVCTYEPSVCETCGPRRYERRPAWWRCPLCGVIFVPGSKERPVVHNCDTDMGLRVR